MTTPTVDELLVALQEHPDLLFCLAQRLFTWHAVGRGIQIASPWVAPQPDRFWARLCAAGNMVAIVIRADSLDVLSDNMYRWLAAALQTAHPQKPLTLTLPHLGLANNRLADLHVPPGTSPDYFLYHVGGELLPLEQHTVGSWHDPGVCQILADTTLKEIGWHLLWHHDNPEDTP